MMTPITNSNGPPGPFRLNVTMLDMVYLWLKENKWNDLSHFMLVHRLRDYMEEDFLKAIAMIRGFIFRGEKRDAKGHEGGGGPWSPSFGTSLTKEGSLGRENSPITEKSVPQRMTPAERVEWHSAEINKLCLQFGNASEDRF